MADISDKNMYLSLIGGPYDGLDYGPPIEKYTDLYLTIKASGGYAHYRMAKLTLNREQRLIRAIYHYAGNVEKHKIPPKSAIPYLVKSGGQNAFSRDS